MNPKKLQQQEGSKEAMKRKATSKESMFKKLDTLETYKALQKKLDKLEQVLQKKGKDHRTKPNDREFFEKRKSSHFQQKTQFLPS